MHRIVSTATKWQSTNLRGIDFVEKICQLCNFFLSPHSFDFGGQLVHNGHTILANKLIDPNANAGITPSTRGKQKRSEINGITCSFRMQWTYGIETISKRCTSRRATFSFSVCWWNSSTSTSLAAEGKRTRKNLTNRRWRETDEHEIKEEKLREGL